jgi:signal transduction histidine kinase
MNISGILLAGMIGLFVMALGFIIIFILYQRRMISKDLEKQKMENDYQRKLLQAAINNQEAERKRIAHDLHDEIGTLLSTSRLYFNQLSPGQAEKQLNVVGDKINALFDEMMLNIRRISHDLRPIVLENFGLAEAIEGIGHKLIDAGLRFQVIYQLTFKMPHEAELILYRIIQELVSNTLKHAKATGIELSLTEKDGKACLAYMDNGIGFDTSARNGLGLKSIESRLSLLNASMQPTKPKKGTHFLVYINITQLTST